MIIFLFLVVALALALLFIGIMIMLHRDLMRTVARHESDYRRLSDRRSAPTYLHNLIVSVSSHRDLRKRLGWFQRVKDLQSDAAKELGVDSDGESVIWGFVSDELRDTQQELLALEPDELQQVVSEFRDLFPGFAASVEHLASELAEDSGDGLKAKDRFRRVLGRMIESATSEKVDPQELQSEHQDAFRDAEAHAAAAVAGYKGRGSSHVYWSHKKQYLLEQHGISWSSPAELNRDIFYD